MTRLAQHAIRFSSLAATLVGVWGAPLFAQSEIHRLNGEFDGQEFGRRVGSPGDIDGDGLVDLLIASGGHGLGVSTQIEARSGGSGGLLYTLKDPFGFGWYVDNIVRLGDVNGDGREEFALSTVTSSATKDVLVFSGVNGSVLYSIPGYVNNSFWGSEMANAGDVNADGVNDLIVGAPGKLTGAPATNGHAFVYSGVDGTELLHFTGANFGDRMGWAVGGAGDVDGDGHADLILGIPYSDLPAADAGSVQVRSGASGGLIHEFKGAQAGDHMGELVLGPGDLDGDLVGDIVLCASKTQDDVRSGATGALLYSFPAGNGLALPRLKSVSVLPDANFDGVPDFVEVSWTTVPEPAYEARAHSGADGSLLYKVGGNTEKSVVGLEDLDGDGRGDLLVGIIETSGQFVYGTAIAFSSGTFQPPGTPTCFGDGSQVGCPCGNTVLYQEGFSGGGLPPGWQANGLWHVTSACAGACGNDAFLYFGIDGTCTYDTGSVIQNHSVFSPPIAIPSPPQGILQLELCWTLGWEGEAEDWILEIHGSGGSSKKVHFENNPGPAELQLTEFAGQTIQIEFRVWTDGLFDTYPGWKIDDLRLRWLTNNGSHPEGCPNSTGRGTLLDALGSNSAAADDLRLFASQAPPSMPAIFVVGTQAQVPPNPFGGGLICFGGQVHRYVAQPTGSLGTVTLENPIAKSNGLLVAGEDYHFQMWHRDSPGQAPCGVSNNLSNAYAVTLTP